MFTELSREDILNELAVIQGYLDKFKDTKDSSNSVKELEDHRDELIESLHVLDIRT